MELFSPTRNNIFTLSIHFITVRLTSRFHFCRLSELSSWYVGLLTILVEYIQHKALTSVEVSTSCEDDWTLLSADDRYLYLFSFYHKE